MEKYVRSSCQESSEESVIDERENVRSYCNEMPSEEEIPVDSFRESLLKVIRLMGKEILKDKDRLIKCWFDFAPGYRKEIWLFSEVCSSKVLQMFFESDAAGNARRKRLVNRVRMTFIEEEGLSGLLADAFVDALVYALGWKFDAEGQIFVIGNNEQDKNNIGNWIISLCHGLVDILCLCRDGKVLVLGEKDEYSDTISAWRDIVAISRNITEDYTVGLRKDGSVVAVGSNKCGRCDVDDWKDIIAISCGLEHTVGLRKNGSVVAVGNNYYGQCNVKDWRDIVSISANDYYTVGLRKDGSVVAVGNNSDGQCDVGDWEDIVSISTGYCYTAGLHKDGSVVAVGWYEDEEEVAELMTGIFE